MRVDESCKTTTGLHFVVAGSAKSCKMADVLEHFQSSNHCPSKKEKQLRKKKKCYVSFSSTDFLKDLQLRSGKMYIRHLYCYGKFLRIQMFSFLYICSNRRDQKVKG